MENASSKHMTRRSFLATTGLAAGALAASGMAGCSSVDTSGEPAATETVEEKTFINTCRGNCGGECVLQAKVRDGKIVSTHPLALPNKYEGVENGCARGMANPLRIYGTHRLLYPMKRVGERGSGEWEQISWDEAIDTIATKFKAAIDEYGPASLCVQVGAGSMKNYLDGCSLQTYNAAPSHTVGVGISRFIQKTGATILTNGDDMAGLYIKYNLTFPPSNALQDLQNAKTIVVWGSNPAEASFSRSSWFYMCKAKEAGARIVVIDPLYTSTAAHADEWVPVRVGTDAALMCAMCNYIIDNGLENVEYLKKGSVAPLLIKDDGSYLRLSDLGMDPDEEENAKTGETESADSPVVWDEATQGFVSHKTAGDPAIRGSFDAEGVAVRTVFDAAVENIAPYDISFAAEECGLPVEQIEELARRCATEGPVTFHIDWGIEHTYNSWRIYLGSAFLAALTGSVGIEGGAYSTGSSKAKLFTAPVNLNRAGLTPDDPKVSKCITGDYLVEIMETGEWAGEEFPVRAMLVQACDPIDNFSGPTDLLKAWEKVDFIVTSELFMTSTAHYSDIVLPAAMPWEAEDFHVNSGYMTQKAVDPIGEVRPDFDIIREIATAMGYEDLYPLGREEYLRELLDTPENIEAGLGYDAYKEKGVIVGEYADATSVSPEYNPLGRTLFYLENMPPRDDWGQTFELKDRMPSYDYSIEAYPQNPDREKYPLFGFSGHDMYHGQSVWAHNAWLDEFRTVDGKPFCRIHESAAEERGIKTGDAVRVYNDHGSCVMNAVVTKGIQAESVWVPHGFFWDEFDEGYAQSLSGHYPDPVSSNSNFNDWICQVEKI